MGEVISDRAATDQRFKLLGRYCEEEAQIDPGRFHCLHLEDCNNEVRHRGLDRLPAR